MQMSDAKGLASALHAPSLPARYGSWPLGVSLPQLCVDGLWILFFMGVDAPLYKLGLALFGLEQPERLFWLPAYLVVLVMLMPWRQEFLRLARRNAILLSWPLLAMASAAWSLTPGISFYHGIQLFMTMMVGFMFVIYSKLERAMQVIFVALAGCAILSFLYVFWAPGDGVSIKGEWSGAYSNKNALGATTALLALCSLCLFLHGWRPFITASAAALAVCLLVLSQSAAASSSLAAAVLLLPVALAYRKGLTPFVAVLGLLLIGTATLLFIVDAMNTDLPALILAQLGKDTTLTGRTMVWEFGMDVYSNSPWLGYGYKGYWQSPETGASILRQLFEVTFFHNNFLEVAIAFGPLGLGLFVAGLAFALVTTLKAFATDPRFITLWPPLYIVFLVAYCFVENPLFLNHSPAQLLFFVAVASSQGRPDAGQA
jgi:O-antigen ligase